jgi:hypothetical protein
LHALHALAPDPFSFMQGCSHLRRDAECSDIAAFDFLYLAPVADGRVPAGLRVFASGLVRHSLSALALTPAPRVAAHYPLPFCLGRGAEAEATLE